MKRSFRFVSLVCIVTILFSCSPKIGQGIKFLPPIVKADAVVQKYNIQMDFMKHHLSGILVVKNMGDNEIRLLSTTYFGPSLFDVSIQGDSLRVNSCIEPMRKKSLLRLLEGDFKSIFLSQNTFKVKVKREGFEKRVRGCGFSKSVIELSKFVGEQPESICIRHPWIRIKIQLDKLNESAETNVTE